MSKPRIFVSSTCYDLKHLRRALQDFIEAFGYEAILSERGDVAYSGSQPLDESCYREAQSSDIYVLVLGSRYGSPASGQRVNIKRDFYTLYDSVTRIEYETAAKSDQQIYVLVERGVEAEFKTWQLNRDNRSITYAHVESVNTFLLLDEIYKKERNNAVFAFDNWLEARGWLQAEWAGLFKDFLVRRNEQGKLSVLSEEIQRLEQLNITLQVYMQELLEKVAPDRKHVISGQLNRLEDEKVQIALRNNRLLSYLHDALGIELEELRTLLQGSANLEEFLKTVASAVSAREPDASQKILELARSPLIMKDYESARDVLVPRSEN